MRIEDMVRVGHYAFVKKLRNGKWSLYVGRWSNSKHGVTGLEVIRDDNDQPIRFVTLQEAREYAHYRAL